MALRLKEMLRRPAFFSARAVATALAVLMCAPAARASSADDLVAQARDHEAANDDGVAARRYTEALSLDATHAGAWLGLGALRMRLGDAAEAESASTPRRVERVPLLRAAPCTGVLEARDGRSVVTSTPNATSTPTSS